MSAIHARNTRHLATRRDSGNNHTVAVGFRDTSRRASILIPCQRRGALGLARAAR